VKVGPLNRHLATKVHPDRLPLCPPMSKVIAQKIGVWGGSVGTVVSLDASAGVWEEYGTLYWRTMWATRDLGTREREGGREGGRP
jgi:hypothetical protein